MLLYLVRHGQTEANKARILDQDKGPLSSEGRADALKLAKRLKHEKIDTLIASDYERTVETATIISVQLKLPITKTVLAREERIPSSLVSKPQDGGSFETCYRALADKHADDPDWHYEDAENPTEMLVRAKKFLAFAQGFSGERICVVTHRGFLRYVAAAVILGEAAEPALVRRYIRPHLEHFNTAITVCEFFSQKGWRLIAWNDQAHLG
ncbi:MAG: histidine phosphatase family protein [Parcubacteria group bacterium]